MVIAANGRLKPYCKTGILITAIFLLLAILSIELIDKPLALFINHLHLPEPLPVANLISEHSIRFLTVIEVCILCLIKPRSELGNRLLLIIYVVAIALVTYWITVQLKIMLGHSWPVVWSAAEGHGSLIADNVYSFHVFSSHTWQGSFPSGHITLVSVVNITMALIVRRYKYIFLGIIPIMCLAILLQNYHFLSDCLSGIAVGAFMAYIGLATYIGLLRLFHDLLI